MTNNRQEGNDFLNKHSTLLSNFVRNIFLRIFRSFIYKSMKTKFLSVALLCLAFTTACCPCDGANLWTIPIIPAPVKITNTAGHFILDTHARVSLENEDQQEIVRQWGHLLFPNEKSPFQMTKKAKAELQLKTNARLAEEAYRLQVTKQGIRIEASSLSGFFYALQTLRMSLPPEIEQAHHGQQAWQFPLLDIEDAPRFGYRGFMLDVARYFSPKDDVLKIIDCMGMLKLNTLHLHLTDDNGWRLEIKQYPKLTQIGAWRVDRESEPFPNRANAAPGEKATVGGYYTQEEMREIIEYAAKRHIEVIPEIDIPAHSNAAIASYPELTCPVVDKHLGVLPGIGGDHSDIILCAGKESVYQFYQNVIDEVVELFPGRYIHLGGDEANKNYWKKCPLCQKRIHEEHLADEEALQGYFMARMSRYVQSKGRQVIGWDELTNSKVPDGAVVMGWRGYGNAAIKAAKKGHQFIMTPARILYLIRYQGPQWFEPLTYFGNNTLKDVYDYEPIQKDWTPAYEQLLMGVQASMWTEFCQSPTAVTYQTFPRLAALAEVAWSPRGSKDWNGFLKANDHFLAHLDSKGITYSKSMYNIQHTVRPEEEGQLKVELECIRPDVEIRYTTDGTSPTPNSPVYHTPLDIKESTYLKAVTFQKKEKIGQVLELPIEWNKATGKTILNAQPAEQLLVNGVHGSLRQSDFEWCGWDHPENVCFTLDLKKEEDIKTVTLRSLTNYGMAVHKPRSLQVEIAGKDQAFTVFGELDFVDTDIFKKGNFTEDLTITGRASHVRYIRITAKGPGHCPDNHVRKGQISRFYFDEIMVR